MTLPLILLPGMMCDARLYAPQLAAFPDATVLPITASDTVEQLAAGVLADAPDRFALGGLSMGGIVAMEVLRQAPHRVARLALMDTNPLAEHDSIKPRRASQIAKARAGHLRDVMRNEMKPHYLAEGPDRQEVLDLCMAMAMDLGEDVFVRQSIALRDRPDQTGTLRAFRGPALVLCGRDDALCPVKRHELMADLIVGADLRIIGRAGHIPTLERPEDTNAALARWLEA